MKRKCTYILIGLLCFLGFSGEVNADYKAICKYGYSGTYNSNNKDRKIYDAELLYDKNEEESFKLIVTFKGEKVKYNNEEDNLSVSNSQTFHFKNISAKGSYNRNLLSPVYYSYEGLNSSSCPKYFIINGGDNEICFYNSDAGKKWCKETMVNPSGDILEGSAIESETYSKIKEGDTCNKSVGTDGDTGQTFAYISFKYTNGGLLIQYKTEENGNLKTVTDNIIKISKTVGSASGNPDKDRIDTRNIYLTNANADLHTDPVIIDTRNDFDRAYLKEWESTGKCPVLSIDPDGYGTDYWILLPDAKADAEKYGSSKIDVNGFTDLKDWDYDWANWFNTRYEYDNCEGLLGENLIALINDILLYVKILIPVALIAFGLIDFVKAVFSSKEDDMKKAQARFIKRLIMAVIVFIVPSIINLLMTAVDGIWAHINNSACNIWK